MTRKLLYCFLTIVVLNSASFSQGTFVNRVYQNASGSPLFNPVVNPFGIQWSSSIISSTGHLYTIGYTTVSGQGQNIFLSKSDDVGNIIFQVNYNTSSTNNDYGINLFEASNGEILVCGTTDNGGSINYDVVVLRYSTVGTLLSSSIQDGPAGLNDVSVAINEDGSGNVLVAANTEATNNFSDYWVLMFDNVLNLVNSSIYDYASLNDVALGLEFSTSGDVCLIGASASGTAACDYAIATFDPVTLSYISDTRNNIPGTALDQALAFTKDAANNMYITGKAWNGTNFDIKTIKIAANLTIAWTATIDVHGYDDLANTIVIDPTNNNVIIGGSATMTNTTKEAICLRYNGSSGTLISMYSQPSENSSGDASIRKLCVNSNGDIYFIGSEKGNSSYEQVVVRKIKRIDNSGWQKSVKNLSYDILPSDIKVTNDEIYVISIRDSLTNAYLTTSYKELELDTARVFSNGKARWKSRELIVSFVPNALNTAEIDNLVGTKISEFGSLSEYLTPSTYTTVKNAFEGICRDCNIKAIKIFDSMKSTDSTVVSRLGEIVPQPPFWSMLVLQFPPSITIQQAASVLNTLPNLVSYSHPNYFVTEVASPPNDPSYSTGQPNLHPTASFTNANINVEEAWGIVTNCGAQFIKCGLFDTGVEWRHADFGYTGSPNSGKIQGWDFSIFNQYGKNLRNTTTPDLFNHGTLTAGVIAAIRNNSIGVAGVAGGDASLGNSGVSLYSLNVFNTTANLLIKSHVESIKTGTVNYNYGINYATCNYLIQQDAGYTADTIASLREAIHFMNRMKVTCVAARGNYNNYTYYPACFDTSWVISVGGTGTNGEYQSPYSYGKGIDVAAPSNTSIVLSTNTSLSYEGYNGTSAATPHAAGVVGLLMSYMNDSTDNYNNLAPEDCDYILQRSATDVGTAGYDTLTGYGRLNAGKALRMVEKPVRILNHYGTNYRFPYSFSKSVYSNSDTVRLTETYKNALTQTVYNKGKYIVQTFQIDATVSQTSTYPTDSIMYIWPRHSSSYVYDLFNAQKKLDLHERVKIISHNNTSATLRGYVYQVWDSTGANPPLGWWPCDTSFSALYVGTNKPKTLMEYSLISKNKAVGLEEGGENDEDKINIFPNPAKHQQTLVLENDHNSKCKVELYDLMGRFIRVVYDGKVETGKTYINHDLAGLMNSMYIYVIKLDDKTISKKFIKD